MSFVVLQVNTISDTVLKAHMLRMTAKVVLDPGQQKSNNLQRDHLLPQHVKLNDVEGVGEGEEHESDSST